MNRADAIILGAAVALERAALAPAPIKGIVRPPETKASKKRDLLEQARRAGWKGKSRKKARQFERKLERDQKAAGR